MVPKANFGLCSGISLNRIFVQMKQKERGMGEEGEGRKGLLVCKFWRVIMLSFKLIN